MEIITFIILILIAAILSALGFFLEPVNPYLILFSSMIIFLISMSMIAEGLEIPNGSTTVDLNITSTTVSGTLKDIKEPFSRPLIATSLNLILLLLSLYLAYFSIDEIIKNKYGETRVN